MNWYKKAQAFTPQTLEDRNLLNEQIAYLEQIRTEVDRLSKVVFQDGVFAKEASYKIANDKKMSSYPGLQDILLSADRIALDSPWKFAALCADAVDSITAKVNKLIKARKTLIEETMPARMRGWVDRHGK